MIGSQVAASEALVEADQDGPRLDCTSIET